MHPTGCLRDRCRNGGRVRTSSKGRHPSYNKIVGEKAFYTYKKSVIEFLDFQKLLEQASAVG